MPPTDDHIRDRMASIEEDIRLHDTNIGKLTAEVSGCRSDVRNLDRRIDEALKAMSGAPSRAEFEAVQEKVDSIRAKKSSVETIVKFGLGIGAVVAGIIMAIGYVVTHLKL